MTTFVSAAFNSVLAFGLASLMFFLPRPQVDDDVLCGDEEAARRAEVGLWSVLGH